MERVLEPELMDDWAGAEAYANSDFTEPHNAFVARFKELFPDIYNPVLRNPVHRPEILDLGCGAADITIRMARSNPNFKLVGYDGSEAMLYYGQKAVNQSGLRYIELKQRMLPNHNVIYPFFSAVISNSLLHHLPDPNILWQSVKELARENAPIFVMDLTRPINPEQARRLVALHSLPTDPDLMKEDFYNSLRAAFRPEEVRVQLNEAGLPQLHVEVVSDRHMMIHGRR